MYCDLAMAKKFDRCTSLTHASFHILSYLIGKSWVICTQCYCKKPGAGNPAEKPSEIDSMQLEGEFGGTQNDIGSLDGFY
jgi:hypothetical protein